MSDAITYSTPVDSGAERRALSALMRGGQEVRHEAAEKLRSDMFTGRRQRIAKEVLALIEEGMRPDFHTVSGRLDKDFQNECKSARQAQCTPANYTLFFDSVRAAYMRRRMMRMGEEIIGEALDMEAGSLELVEAAQEKAERSVTGLSGEVLGGESVRHISASSDKALEMLRAADEETLTGVTTGFREIDRMTRGGQDGHFYVLAARPGMGKSALMGQCALSAALGEAGVRHKGSYEVEPTPTAIFSLEMPAYQLSQRMCCERARINWQKKGHTDEEWQRIIKAKAEIDEAPIFVDDTPSITPREIGARLRRLVREEGVRCAWVDYLQIVGTPRGVSFDRESLRLGYAVRYLRDLAKELDIPIWALSQLNRGVESGSGPPRPRISDIRESGEIEETANVVAMLYRPFCYGITRDEAGDSVQTDVDGRRADIAEFIVGKNRGGPTGTRKLAFVREHSAFRDLDPRERKEENRPSYAGEPAEYGAPSRNGTSSQSGTGAPVPSSKPPF